MDRTSDWFPSNPRLPDVGAMMYAATAASGFLPSSFWSSMSSAMSGRVWRRLLSDSEGGAEGCGRGAAAVLLRACDRCFCRCDGAEDSVVLFAFRRLTFSSVSLLTGPFGVEKLFDPLLLLPEELLKIDAELVCVTRAGTGGLTRTFFGRVARVWEMVFSTGPSSDVCRAYCLNTSSILRSAFCCCCDDGSSAGPLGIRRSCDRGSIG